MSGFDYLCSRNLGYINIRIGCQWGAIFAEKVPYAPLSANCGTDNASFLRTLRFTRTREAYMHYKAVLSVIYNV